ncbi:unnamed protein product [Lota lota]
MPMSQLSTPLINIVLPKQATAQEEHRRRQCYIRSSAKNQLVSSGLARFDNLPEHYQAWKATVNNLDFKATEEMDLLEPSLPVEIA